MRPSYPRTLIFVVLLVFSSAAAISASAQSLATQPRLDPVTWRPDAETIPARGFDPLAPRPLDLWVWRNESFDRIGETRSLFNGRFDFGQIGVPQEALFLAVTSRGERPSTDRMNIVERPVLAPIIAITLNDAIDELVIHPARLEGELRFRNAATGALLARVPIEPGRPGTTVIDVFELLGPRPPIEIRVQQVLDDGRASPSAYYRFDIP